MNEEQVDEQKQSLETAQGQIEERDGKIESLSEEVDSTKEACVTAGGEFEIHSETFDF